MQFRKWRDSDLTNLIHVGVFLGRNVALANQLHMGYLVRSESDGIRFIHLAFHHDLRNDSPVGLRGLNVDEVIWERCIKLDEDVGQEAFGLRLIECVASQQVPYSFMFDNNPYFDSSLAYVGDTPGRGLTCSTFVLATWEAYGYGPLLVADQWVERDGDNENRDIILNWLRARADKAHVEAIENYQHVVRFRPEEVSASAASGDTPLSLETATERAEALLAILG